MIGEMTTRTPITQTQATSWVGVVSNMPSLVGILSTEFIRCYQYITRRIFLLDCGRMKTLLKQTTASSTVGIMAGSASHRHGHVLPATRIRGPRTWADAPLRCARPDQSRLGVKATGTFIRAAPGRATSPDIDLRAADAVR